MTTGSSRAAADTTTPTRTVASENGPTAREDAGAVSASSAAIPGAGVGELLISVRALTKRFTRHGGEVVNAVDGVDVDVHAGEILCLLGPSGCGKTTLLRCIAGLERPSAGTIAVGGRTVFSSSERIQIPPEKRRLSMMFQSYALWPHMTVSKNVAYPLRSQGVGRKAAAERVAEVLEIVGIPELGEQMPGAMSGGQQQRVALARSLAANPSVILFDEPLSNVDAKVRESLRVEILEMHRRLGFAAIYVTHDQEEAMRMGDRVAVLNAGVIADIGTPERIYERPASRYVANFVGKLNELEGTIVAVDPEGSCELMVQGAALRLPPGCVVGEQNVGGQVAVTVRPERLHIGSGAPGGDIFVLSGLLVRSMFVGAHTEYLVDVGGELLTVWSSPAHVGANGTRVDMWCNAQDLHAFTI